MSGSYWRSPSYLDTFEWLVLSLNPLKARSKAKACSMINDMEWQTLADMDGRAPRHNETLLRFLERSEDAFSCLIAIVAEQGFDKKATHLRGTLPSAPLPTPRHPPAATSVASTHHSASLEPSEPQSVQEPPNHLRQAPPKEPPLQLHLQPEAEAHLRQDDHPQPEAKGRPPHVYPLDDLKSGRVQAAAESIRHDALNSSLVVEVYRSSSGGVDESTMKWMKVHVILGKVNPHRNYEVLSTLRKKFKVNVEAKCSLEDPEVKAMYMESDDTALKEYYDKVITTVEIVVGVDKPGTEQTQQEVAQLIKSSLRKCGVDLLITCVDIGCIIIYGLLPVTDLIRLYSIAARYPGVLAGLGILEIGTLGRETRFSFRPSPAGPDRVPLDSSTTDLVRDISPPDQVEEILGEANVHYVLRELISCLPPDDPALERVLQWLEAHGTAVSGASESLLHQLLQQLHLGHEPPTAARIKSSSSVPGSASSSDSATVHPDRGTLSDSSERHRSKEARAAQPAKNPTIGMSDVHRKALNKCRVGILDNLDVDGVVLHFLYSQNIVTEDLYADIRDAHGRPAKAKLLLDDLPSCGKMAFDTFVEALTRSRKIANKELAELLRSQSDAVMTSEHRQELLVLHPAALPARIKSSSFIPFSDSSIDSAVVHSDQGTLSDLSERHRSKEERAGWPANPTTGMSSVHQETLFKFRGRILENLEVEGVVIEVMYSKQIVPQALYKDIQDVCGRKEKAKLLLDYLPSCSTMAFETFVEALTLSVNRANNELAELLRTGTGTYWW